MSAAVYPRSFGVFYDFRNPAAWEQPWQARYWALLEQIAWVDADLPYADISLSEHHFVQDGWSPSIMALAAAVAARTERVGISTNIVQLPLHHPLRVAEDALTIDILSGGRFRLGVSAGYRAQEFEGMGVSLEERGSRMDEALEILRAAFTGQPFAHSGRHWSFPELQVTPGTIRQGGPSIWIGGKADPAVRRAAAQGDGFMASGLEDVAAYLAARRSLGFQDDPPATMRTSRMIIAEDPERAAHELGDHLLFQVNQYVDYGFLPGPYRTDVHELLRDGLSEIVDAQGALQLLQTAAEAGVDEVHLFAVVPGEPVESGSRRLQYVAEHVIGVIEASRQTA